MKCAIWHAISMARGIVGVGHVRFIHSLLASKLCLKMRSQGREDTYEQANRYLVVCNGGMCRMRQFLSARVNLYMCAHMFYNLKNVGVWQTLTETMPKLGGSE